MLLRSRAPPMLKRIDPNKNASDVFTSGRKIFFGLVIWNISFETLSGS